MSTSQLLDRLEGVKSTGAGRWIARCPAHEDRSPSLSIREADDGMTLVRCWAGCEFAEIVGAAGLQPADLFPPKPLPAGDQRQRGYSRPFPAADILAAVAHEALYVALAARDLAGGVVLSGSAVARLFVAAGRLLQAARAGGANA
jgi:hypothetical protein